MFYDYLLTQIYPTFEGIIIITFLLLAISSTFYWTLVDDEKPRKKYVVFAYWVYVCLTLLVWATIYLAPDQEYLEHYFGPVRPVTIEQREMLQSEYDEHFNRSKQLLLDCLDKGQKQPHTTTFNDTNEVVQTCYDVARYKF